MTKQDLIDRSLEEIDKLKNEEFIDTSELDFYVEFVSKYTPFSIEMLKKLSISDFYKAILTTTFESLPFSKVNKDVDKFGPMLEKMEVVEFVMLAELLNSVDEKGLFDSVIKCIEDKNNRRGFRNLRELLDTDDNEMVLECLEMIFGDGDMTNLIPLLKYHKAEPRFMRGLLCVVHEIKNIIENDERIESELNIMKKCGMRISEKEKNKRLNRLYNDVFDIDKLKSCFNEITKHYDVINKKYTNQERERSKKIRNYEDFINSLNRLFNREEISNYETILKKIADDDIRLDFLKMVYQNNSILYEDLESTYKELSKNSTINYLALLKKYDISKDEIDLSKVMKNSCDDVKEILELVSLIIDDKSTIIKAVQTTDLEACKYLKVLKAKGVLSANTIRQYPDVFDTSSSVFTMLNKNIETLNNYKINPAVFVNNPEVLLGYSLEEKLSILEDYNLIKSMKSNGNYSYLAKDNLVELIDKVLELGYENFLVGDLTLLNEDNWDRIYILKSIGEEVTKKADLLAVLRDNDFIVPDSKISKYIANIVPYYNYNDSLDPTLLNSFNGSDRTYDFNGIIVSKNRFKRNYNNDMNAPLLKNLVDGGIYSREEVELIEESINETKEK